MGETTICTAMSWQWRWVFCLFFENACSGSLGVAEHEYEFFYVLRELLVMRVYRGGS